MKRMIGMIVIVSFIFVPFIENGAKAETAVPVETQGKPDTAT
ncbi:Uncharacterised protein [Niallia circulans]|jgi:hypothetical protein|nr:hypothetical protein [Shouchella clausii]MEB5471466.1 hypothetical protein [Shouchella clausii]WQG94865.1 hypothetical protein SR921_20340 [Shouchella clausii]SPU17801.1 Uncharacterised protein [Niallia circulans]